MLIPVFMFLGSILLHAGSGCADTVTDHVALCSPSLQDAIPYFAAVKRVVSPSVGMPFNLSAKGRVGGFVGQQLLSIADKQADNAIADLHAHSACDEHGIEQELEEAVKETFDALCIFLSGKDMLIAHRGSASKALLLKSDDTVASITAAGDSATSLIRLPYAQGHKGVALLRGMSLTDERVAQIVTTSCTITPNPQVIAQALVDADAGDAVAAAYLDYNLLHASIKRGLMPGGDAHGSDKNSGCLLL